MTEATKQSRSRRGKRPLDEEQQGRSPLLQVRVTPAQLQAYRKHMSPTLVREWIDAVTSARQQGLELLQAPVTPEQLQVYRETVRPELLRKWIVAWMVKKGMKAPTGSAG